MARVHPDTRPSVPGSRDHPTEYRDPRMGIEDRLHRYIVDELVHDRLVLPTLPEAALRVRDLATREDVTAAQLSAEIGRDPALAVRLLRVANSAAQRGNARIESLQQAVTRLGIGYTRLLVESLVMEQLFTTTTPALREHLRGIWQRSVAVAGLSQVIAAHCTLLDPARAMLAGLVHEVGALPVIRVADSQAERVEPGPMLEAVIRLLAPRIGRLVLQAWHFPPELVAVPTDCVDLQRTHDGPADYADVVCVARLQVLARAAPLSPAVPEALPAHRKLDLSPTVDLLEIGTCRERYETTCAALAA